MERRHVHRLRRWGLSRREFGLGKHRSVDDTPAGGGAGLVMRADVLAPALDAAIENNPLARRIYLSPRGKPLTQTMTKSLSQIEGVVFLAGRFEGVDQRIIDAYQLEELSIGDYVLSGGELAAMVVLDSIVRLLPGAIGSEESLDVESFEAGLLEHPHYTKPRLWNGREIPEVLLSGDHGKVEQWRRERALELTKKRRPDLLAKKS